MSEWVFIIILISCYVLLIFLPMLIISLIRKHKAKSNKYYYDFRTDKYKKL